MDSFFICFFLFFYLPHIHNEVVVVNLMCQQTLTRGKILFNFVSKPCPGFQTVDHLVNMASFFVQTVAYFFLLSTFEIFLLDFAFGKHDLCT